MRMSEEVAKTKWCPFARALDAAEEASGITAMTAANRTSKGKIDIGAFCIASDCMAWRWFNDPAPPKAREGFCGLAGTAGAVK